MKPGNRFAKVNNGANAVPPTWGNDKKLRPLLTEEVFFLANTMANSGEPATVSMAMSRASVPIRSG